MLFPFPRAMDDASSSTFDAVRTARRALFLLAVLAVLGPVLAAAASTITNLWTYQGLQEAEQIALALRVQGDIDQLHDALRGDVAVTAQLQRLDAEFEVHARSLEEGVEAFRGLALPQAVADRADALRMPLLEYVATARRAMLRTGGPSRADVEQVHAKWLALERPLADVSNQLQASVADAERRGRVVYHNGNLVRAIALLSIIGGILLGVHRISTAVLHTSRELAAATENARRASQSRADFLAAMSHEIRTPMTGVLGMADLLAAEKLEGRQRSYVDGLRASGRHLLNVINDILDFTRIESGRLELERIDFSLPELLERVRSLVHPMVVARGLDLRMDLSPQSPSVLHGDPTRIQQVLLNLVGNAVKFTDKGSVSVVARPVPQDSPGPRHRFEVHDTGIGIAPQGVAELFSAFRQADESIHRRFGGSGLGLAICKKLVEAMGGTIGVDSVPGEGSNFWFELPLAAGGMEPRATRGREERAPLPPQRILVAEDVEINRQILGTTLAGAGHVLTFAHDGARAVELARSQAFDLILMDVQMPVMDGLEATRRIRDLQGPSGRVPILALTANVMAQERERYLAAGMDECLMKPIDWDQLFGAIARHACADGQVVEPGGGCDGASRSAHALRAAPAG